MPRSARIVAANVPHHVTQRGNNRRPIFLDDEDRQFYLNHLGLNIRKFAVSMLGFCLMTNHTHAILIPSQAEALANALGKTHSRYTQYFNFKYGCSGHLWQSRFFSCPLDISHLWDALCYIERNPVRAQMVEKAWDYPWSSAKAHVSGEDGTGLLSLELWRAAYTPLDWRKTLETTEELIALEKMRKAVIRGRF